MSRRPLLCCLLLASVGCAEPEPKPEREPLEGSGIFREEQTFKKPPPLKPQTVEIKQEQLKPAWKAPPQRVLDQDADARAQVEESRSSARDVEKAMAETEGEVRAAADRRRRRQQAKTREQAAAARQAGEQVANSHAQEVALARQAAAKSHASRVEAYLAEARRRAGSRGRQAAVDEAYRLRERAMARAERARRLAESSRDAAKDQERLNAATLEQGVVLPGSEGDLRRTREGADELDLEAIYREALAEAAAEAHRRLLLGRD